MFSGGKDSTRSIELVEGAGYDVSCLVTIISDNPESYMLHTPNIDLAPLSAKALDLPIEIGHTKGEKEKEISDITQTVERAKNTYGFEVLVSGGLASNYQKTRLETIAKSCGLVSINPLWGIDQKEHLTSLVKDGYRFIITSVSAEGLGPDWLGRTIDEKALSELLHLSSTHKFNVAFEGGEAETLVLDCPRFRNAKINIIESQKEWDGYIGKLDIKTAELILKTGRARSTGVSSLQL